MTSSPRLLIAAFVSILCYELTANPLPPASNQASPDSNSLAAITGALQTDDIAAAVHYARRLSEAGDSDAQHVLGVLHDLGLGVPLNFEESVRLNERAAAGGNYWGTLYLAWKYRSGLGLPEPKQEKAAELQQEIFKRAAPERVIPPEWLKISGVNFAPNYPRAARWITKQAQEGNAEAMMTLASYYLYGLGVRIDQQQHLRWLSISGERGHAAALEKLELYYRSGFLVAENTAIADDYLLKAAEAGSAESQYSLGRAAEKRKGQLADLNEAITWYRKAAAADHAAAINRLADILRSTTHPEVRDLPGALALSKRGAALGDPEAMADLANMLRRGEGTQKDLPGALQLYRTAAEKGYAYASYMVGWTIIHSDSEPKDYAEARRWLDIAAEKGNSSAMREIGMLYSEGRGVPVDANEAFSWFERAARKGNDWAQNRIGWMLQQGVGIEKDEEEAASWYRLAVKQGNTTAMVNLGDLLRRGAPGVEQDSKEALRLYQAAAKEGSAYGSYMVGWMLTYSEAEERDYDEARRWFDRAAQSGYVPALSEIGLQYSAGRGTAIDHKEAFDWFLKAAEKHNSWAQNRVGWILLRGAGVAPDHSAAVDWFRKAASQDNVTALINLGRCYEDGRGTERNLTMAADCFRKAIMLGQPAGIGHLARIATKLRGEEQLALFNEITPQILARESKAENWELGLYAGVLLHNSNPLNDHALGRSLLDRSKEAKKSPSQPPKKISIEMDTPPLQLP